MDFFYKRKINYYETDKMGIVHHSNYIRFLEEARSDWLESIGIPMGELESRGYTIPTLEVHIKYKHHVTCGDVITIRPAVTEYNGCRITVCYEVKSGENTVIEAYTKHCFTTSKFSTAFGYYTEARGRNATAWGVSTTATGKNSTAWESVATASGHSATAWGYKTEASGRNATAWAVPRLHP